MNFKYKKTLSAETNKADLHTTKADTLLLCSYYVLYYTNLMKSSVGGVFHD